MAKRLRRFTMTVNGSSVTGARNFSYEDSSEYNRDRADNEVVGDEVRMSEGPFTIRFEMLAEDANVASGYVNTMVVTYKEIERSGASESSTDKTLSFSQGHFKVGGDHQTETPGRIPVTGEFKELTKA